MQTPIAVVGGGIAGLNVALRLVRRRIPVTLFEKRSGPIDKVCGEGLLPFGVKLLAELGLEDQVRALGTSFEGIEYLAGGRRVEGSFCQGPRGIGIARGVLDDFLRQQCLALNGFQLVQGQKVQLADLKEFAQVIAADGAHSQLAGELGRHPEMGPRLGVRFRVQVAPPRRVRVAFAEFGEIYITPVAADHLSVAMLLDVPRIPKGPQLKPWCLTQFRQTFPEYDGVICDFATRGHIVSRVKGPLPPFHLVGDALHTFDPISGAGMSVALWGGKMAADHLTNVAGYFSAMKPVLRSVDAFTRTILAFRGGGWRTDLMLRQLSKTPTTFDRILALHDGAHLPWHLGWRQAGSLLRVW